MVAQRLRGVKGASGADGDSHMRQMERLLLSVKKHFLKKNSSLTKHKYAHTE